MAIEVFMPSNVDPITASGNTGQFVVGSFLAPLAGADASVFSGSERGNPYLESLSLSSAGVLH
jgi:hypothetical protein